jgi:hypothetical protein
VGHPATGLLRQRDPVPALGVLCIAQAFVGEREIVGDLRVGGREVVGLLEPGEGPGQVTLLQRRDALEIPGARQVGEGLVHQAGHALGAGPRVGLDRRRPRIAGFTAARGRGEPETGERRDGGQGPASGQPPHLRGPATRGRSARAG